jgi:restriction system protein
MSARYSSLRVVYNSRGWASYEIELSHDGLHKHRIIKGNDPDFVQRKAAVQLADWEEQWSRKLAVQDKVNQASQRKRVQERQKEFAAEQSKEAQEVIENLRNTLRQTLDRNDAIDWERLKDQAPFPKSKPAKPKLPQPPSPSPIPREPLNTGPRYQPQLGLLDKLLTSRREQKLREAAQLFQRDHQQWEQERRNIIVANEEKRKQYEQLVRKAEETYRDPGVRTHCLKSRPV